MCINRKAFSRFSSAGWSWNPEFLIPFSLSPSNNLEKTVSKHLVLFLTWDCKATVECVPVGQTVFLGEGRNEAFFWNWPLFWETGVTHTLFQERMLYEINTAVHFLKISICITVAHVKILIEVTMLKYTCFILTFEYLNHLMAHFQPWNGHILVLDLFTKCNSFTVHKQWGWTISFCTQECKGGWGHNLHRGRTL